MALNVNEKGRPWSVSEGGPVLAIPAELAGAWRGTLPPIGATVPDGWEWGDSGGPECDYDRACDAKPFIGTGFGGFRAVPVGDGHALALESEVVTEWHAADDGGYLVRPAYAESTPDPANVKTWTPYPGATSIALRDGRLFLFDSAASGDADPQKIEANAGVGVVALEPGTYELHCAEDDGENDYVRLRRVK
jgi:hypothetical protein